ncbi:MAG: ASCH domain-containing protein [Eubacteriales bacterium]|nr:ASCH domain-containing protein [Eubacteriales bacterium]
MKALSIYPEPVMEIFMGDKTIEYRTWQTDYRGDLLICAGSKKEPGFVNGYAYFVVSLLDIRLEDGWDDDQRGYEWMLGAPRLIRPIPVRGRLFLFDVDDAQIHYIEGGDLGAYPSWQKANEFRKAYAKQYLEPIMYRPNIDTHIGGIYGSVIAPEEKPEPPKPAVDMPVQSLLDAILSLDPFPPTTVDTSRAHPEFELGLARYPSQKVGAVKWLQGLIKRKKTSGREAYNEKQNLLCLLWLAEALGEGQNILIKAIENAMAYNTMPERCEAFRLVIPFNRIKELVDNIGGWRIDPAMKSKN